ncbi:uncharacterized protein [Miscanthus floridulus]|uniref:uncharacterized protein n=1 Tax=Miscanthus floridulus TaxID=154761 RepID=UPI00345AFA53
MKQAGEEAPTPHEAEALEPGEAEAPSIAEATESEAEAIRTSEAEVADAGPPRTNEAEVAEAGAPGTTEAEAAEAGLEMEASRVTEASWVEVQNWRVKAEGLEKEVTRGAEASVAVQAVLEAKIREHNVLQSAACTTCEALERALAVVSSHYAGINLEAVSDGYVVSEDDEKAEEEVMKLVEAAEAPSTTLASLFEEEVVPPTPTADASDPEF